MAPDNVAPNETETTTAHKPAAPAKRAWSRAARKKAAAKKPATKKHTPTPKRMRPTKRATPKTVQLVGLCERCRKALFMLEPANRANGTCARCGTPSEPLSQYPRSELRTAHLADEDVAAFNAKLDEAAAQETVRIARATAAKQAIKQAEDDAADEAEVTKAALEADINAQYAAAVAGRKAENKAKAGADKAAAAAAKTAAAAAKRASK